MAHLYYYQILTKSSASMQPSFYLDDIMGLDLPNHILGSNSFILGKSFQKSFYILGCLVTLSLLGLFFMACLKKLENYFLIFLSFK